MTLTKKNWQSCHDCACNLKRQIDGPIGTPHITNRLPSFYQQASAFLSGMDAYRPRLAINGGHTQHSPHGITTAPHKHVIPHLFWRRGRKGFLHKNLPLQKVQTQQHHRTWLKWQFAMNFDSNNYALEVWHATKLWPLGDQVEWSVIIAIQRKKYTSMSTLTVFISRSSTAPTLHELDSQTTIGAMPSNYDIELLNHLWQQKPSNTSKRWLFTCLNTCNLKFCEKPSTSRDIQLVVLFRRRRNKTTQHLRHLPLLDFQFLEFSGRQKCSMTKFRLQVGWKAIKAVWIFFEIKFL